MLTQNHRQEALSRAYVQAIVAQAGMSYSIASHDYGIDLSINDIEKRGRRRRETGFRLDVQAKSTTLAGARPRALKYKLEMPAYEHLRATDAGCPRILVVLVLPVRESDWCRQSEERLVLRRCAYWLSLRGYPPTHNRQSVQVVIPRANVFSATALQAMMKRVKSGGMP